MPTHFKRDAGVFHDDENPGTDVVNDGLDFAKGDNIFYKILKGFLKQGSATFFNLVSRIVKKPTRNRSSTRNRADFIEDEDFEAASSEKRQRHYQPEGQFGPLLSGAAYCISSCSMLLLNKTVLSSYDFSAGISLMFYQNLVSVTVIIALKCFGAVSTEKISWKLVRIWAPVNLVFIAMLVTGMYSLKHVNIAMVTILKNVTNMITAIGEYYFFKKRQNRKVWIAMVLMVVSAVSGGITDLSFDVVGYTWQIMNCFLTAGYSLTMRHVMDTAKQATRSGSLSEVSMALLNNVLSLPFAVLLILLFKEWRYVYDSDVIGIPMFWVVATTSGLLGLAISVTSIWFLNQTSATTYSLVGSLNKIPISIAGIFLFSVPLSTPNLLSIIFGLCAGIFFAKAKVPQL